jgi:glycosyltransferase 2 family protein
MVKPSKRARRDVQARFLRYAASVRLMRLLLLMIGVALFLELLREIGPSTVAASFEDLSWRLLVLLVFPFILVTVCDTLGWRFAFTRTRVPFLLLLRTRLIGESFNATTPTASVGGDAVKTWLLTDHVGVDTSLASVIVAKTTIAISQVLFLAIGIVVAITTLSPSRSLLWTMLGMLAVESLAVTGFVIAQTAGLLQHAGRLVAWTGVASGAELERVQIALRTFYRREGRRFVLSVTFHLLGWVFSALEAYAIMWCLDVPVSPASAIFVEAFGAGVRFASFMIPAHFGALEGAHVASFVAIGLDASTGLSFSLTRRIREAAWVGAGFLALAQRRWARPRVPVPAAPVTEG